MGTCTVHSWNDNIDEDEAEPRTGLRVDAKLVPEQEDPPERQSAGFFGRRRVRRPDL
jgi:WD repeat-containing protein 23